MKNPQLENFLESFVQNAFGTSRQADACVFCRSTKVAPSDFCDDLSRREYEISRTCQSCQDKTFGVNE